MNVYIGTSGELKNAYIGEYEAKPIYLWTNLIRPPVSEITE